MNCIAVMETGSYALALANELETAGIGGRVVSTPCKLSKEGCGYSVSFDCNDKEKVLKVASDKNIKVKSIYKVNKDRIRTRYKRIV